MGKRKKTKGSIRLKLILRVMLFIIGSFIACIAASTYYIGVNPPYFEDFEDEEAVRAEILSVLPIGETSIDDVLDVVENRRFGSLDCAYYSEPLMIIETPVADGPIICRTHKRNWSYWFWIINFSFDGNILVRVEISDFYFGP